MDLYALVVDADAEERRVVRNALHNNQWRVSEAASIEEAMRVVDRYSWRLVFCAADLSKQFVDSSNDLTLLRAVKTRCDDAAHIVVIVEAGKPTDVLEAIFNGASDYIRKPCREEEIYGHSRRMIERLRAAENEASFVHGVQELQSHVEHDGYELVGKSDAILRVFRELAKSVRNHHGSNPAKITSKHFLLTGETGTGKELVAHLIHRYSRYRAGPFIAVNCSTLPTELADSELFGSSPGAFTGADRQEHPGLWEMANNGTLFLDEITEAPRSVMPKLLRVLQDGHVRRLGAKRWIKTDVQVIAATNRNLAEDVKRGRFREDVYHRLSQHQIYMPPLRERLEDVPLLASHFARMHSAGTIKLGHNALRLLVDFSRDYEWRGNVRELENVIRRAVEQAPDKTVFAVDLAPHLPAKDEAKTSPKQEGAVETAGRRDCVCNKDIQGGLDEQVRRFRNSVVRETLAAHNNSRTRAAKSLQVSRSTMHRLIDELEQEHNLR